MHNTNEIRELAYIRQVVRTLEEDMEDLKKDVHDIRTFLVGTEQEAGFITEHKAMQEYIANEKNKKKLTRKAFWSILLALFVAFATAIGTGLGTKLVALWDFTSILVKAQ